MEIDWTSVESVSAGVLAHLPQQRPFRFLDGILEIDETRISGTYTFRPDETFYEGHFPGAPVTPGVILIEAMAQTGVVALGIYLVLRENVEKAPGAEDPKRILTLFTDCKAEFFKEVLPGDTIVVKAERLFWRKRKLRVRAEAFVGDTLVATAELAGMGVVR